MVGAEEYDSVFGAVLFVVAGAEHRIFRFSKDFSEWVLFYGIKGSKSPCVIQLNKSCDQNL